MALTTPPTRGATVATPVASSQGLFAIGVGIDTARYGHVVSFLRPDRQPAAKKLVVLENRASYQALRERLEQLHQQHPQAHFHIRIDAAGQYANNLERFLRSLPLPMTLSIGEPKRNRDYQKAHFPKRQTDETESIAMARFAVVEGPAQVVETMNRSARNETSFPEANVHRLSLHGERHHAFHSVDGFVVRLVIMGHRHLCPHRHRELKHRHRTVRVGSFE